MVSSFLSLSYGKLTGHRVALFNKIYSRHEWIPPARFFTYNPLIEHPEYDGHPRGDSPGEPEIVPHVRIRLGFMGRGDPGLASLDKFSENNREQVDILSRLWTDNPNSACDEARDNVTRK
jgi:hypothetical protein